MLAGWAVVLIALTYLCALFAVAYYGDGSGRWLLTSRARPTIYALALAVYCTSWTFYGSVGLASTSGLDFLAVYIGPVIMIGFGHRLLSHVVRLAKSQNTTSIADFVAARYGKSESVAAIVALVALIGSVPYIALQLKAISSSLSAILEVVQPEALRQAMPGFGDLALFVALILAGFSIAFGTRNVDATEHQDGLMLAIAMESLVKLVAFLAVGCTVVFFLFDGFGDIFVRAAKHASFGSLIEQSSGLSTFLTITLISGFAALLLPRQFHVCVVENRDVRDVRKASRLFCIYLVLINLFVIPIALAGHVQFPSGLFDRDMTVLALPLARGYDLIAMLAFVGGLSAATAMVIVESVAISVMVSNDLVMPLILKRSMLSTSEDSGARRDGLPRDLGLVVMLTRRVAILAILLLAYLYYGAAANAALASIGLISFAAIAQIAPAFFGGLLWRRATAAGAASGLVAGLSVWAYTLLLPSLSSLPPLLDALVKSGPFDIALLKPTALLGMELPRLTHGILWSLGVNLAFFVVVSHLRQPTTSERLQASAFIGPDNVPMTQSLRLWRSSTKIGELKQTIARYLGEDRTRDAFASFAASTGAEQNDDDEADLQTMHFGEHLLASAIGAASSRLVLSLLLRRRNVSTTAALKLLDEASAALQYSRDILQNALDHARQGITVFDRDLHLMCWNHAFGEIYGLPRELLRVGTQLQDIIQFNAQAGSYGTGDTRALAERRLTSFTRDIDPVRLRLEPAGSVIEIRSSHIPGGGIVTTYTDITETVAAEEALERSNETLERRVKERTEELVRVNGELERAKGEADDANASKTRFLAAASHDILQPLNAARLYAATLVERDRDAGQPELAENVDGSLEAVEEILSALLEISKLDGKALSPELSNFRLDEVFRQLAREFEPLALKSGVRLRFVATSLTIRSDRRLLRRLLQNLVSNAVKYAPQGKVLVGCRRIGNKVRVAVLDTGLGIPKDKQRVIFREFQRLDQGARTARGLGLGLSIVERIARLIDHPITVRSVPRRGSAFSFLAPIAAPMPAFASTVDADPPSNAPLTGLVVLAIDNEPAILDGMRKLLGKWGCEVVTAASLVEARKVLKAGRIKPDVIIADYHLDEGNGIDAIVALRWKLDPDTPAVLLTADRSAEVAEAAHEKGIHLINKPLKPAALRALLAQWRLTRLAAE